MLPLRSSPIILNQQSIKDYVLALSIPSGETLRTDCPVCGGKNTFTATKDAGNLLWNCYRASCSINGRGTYARSIDEIRLAYKKTQGTNEEGFVVPNYFVSPYTDTTCLKYLERHHCVRALADRRAGIEYDTKLDRCVFLVREPKVGGEVVGAHGRALTTGDRPKWLAYGKTRIPYTCRGVEHSAIATIVEDATSATTVSAVTTGIALLGTSFQQEFIPFIVNREYKRVLIALDKDATVKALEMQRKLSWYIDTKIVPLEDDLKYLTPDKIREKLGDFV